MGRMNDPVNHPAHYTSDPSGVECIEITRHRNFNIGNAIKYLWRAGLKDDPSATVVDKQVEDLEKAIWYIRDEIQRLRGIQESPERTESRRVVEVILEDLDNLEGSQP